MARRLGQVFRKGKSDLSLLKFQKNSFLIQGGNLPKLILFRPDASEPTTLLFRAVSIKYHRKVVVGLVSSRDDPELAAKINLNPDKTHLVYFSNGNSSNFIIYDREISRSGIFNFINDQLAKANESKDDL